MFKIQEKEDKFKQVENQCYPLSVGSEMHSETKLFPTNGQWTDNIECKDTVFPAPNFFDNLKCRL